MFTMTKKLGIAALFSAGMFMLSAPNSYAVIMAGAVTGGTALTNGGVFQELVAPIGNVGNDNQQSYNLFAFNEDQNIVLPGNLATDVGLSPIPSGTEVASHYVFFDPKPAATVFGYVDFDSDVLAIITSTGNLAASDFLVSSYATYLNPGLRGLETSSQNGSCPGGPFNDTATIDGANPKRVNVALCASSPGDYIRVITERSPGAAIPEPSSLLLLLGGLGLGLKKRFKLS